MLSASTMNYHTSFDRFRTNGWGCMAIPCFKILPKSSFRRSGRPYLPMGMNRLMTIVKNDEPNKTAPITNRVIEGPANPSVN